MLSTESDIKIIKKTISDNILHIKGKELYIFGCIVQARDIRDELQEYGCILDGFIDNNPGKAGNGKRCLGVPVLFPTDLPADDNKLIIICSKYFSEMKNQLEKLGFGDGNILRIPIDDDVKKWSDDEASIKSAIERIKKGNEFYESILNENSNLDRIFLCPYPGTGDIYMACSFLPEYLRMHKISKYIILVIGNSCRKVAELFEKGNVLSITREEADGLLGFWEFASEETIIKPLLYWGWRTKRFLYADKYPQISFTEMFLYDVFGFHKRFNFRKPIQESKEVVRRIFVEEGLVEGKTIIIAPYAGSFVTDIDIKVWEEISARLKKEGYIVCTNSSGEDEKAIKGTKSIFFPYTQAIPFVELAGCFIAIRSGLCDVISSAECKKIILYEDGFNATRMAYFGLERMGLCKRNIYEMDYSTWDSNEIIENLLKCIAI